MVSHYQIKRQVILFSWNFFFWSIPINEMVSCVYGCPKSGEMPASWAELGGEMDTS